jgi:hypothetical protein
MPDSNPDLATDPKLTPKPQKNDFGSTPLDRDAFKLMLGYISRFSRRCYDDAATAAYLNFLDHTVTGDDLAEDDMLPVQPIRLGGGDEELAPVGAGP